MATILVSYATKQGSTAEVADFVAKRLETHGATVDVRRAREVRDLSGYDAVVLGAPLYMGRWHGDARGFVRRRRKALATMPFAVFALGPVSSKEEDMIGARKQLDGALARVRDVTPLAVGLFAGVIEPAKLRFPFNKMPAGDWRDWDAIGAWADEVARAFELPTLELVEVPATQAPAF
jgi:menaquinone-dependent protoporphyrinogen oxidase